MPSEFDFVETWLYKMNPRKRKKAIEKFRKALDDLEEAPEERKFWDVSSMNVELALKLLANLDDGGVKKENLTTADIEHATVNANVRFSPNMVTRLDDEQMLIIAIANLSAATCSLLKIANSFGMNYDIFIPFVLKRLGNDVPGLHIGAVGKDDLAHGWKPPWERETRKDKEAKLDDAKIAYG
jgi:hypothetical protein